jgi:hypothetical protein
VRVQNQPPAESPSELPPPPAPAAEDTAEPGRAETDSSDRADTGEDDDGYDEDEDDDKYEDDDEDEAPPPARAGHGTRDMVISLAVLLVPLAIVFAVSRLLGGGDVVVVDPGPAFSQAAAAFPVVTPHGLADGWRPVRATFQAENDGKALRVGYVTPAGGAIQLIESDEAVDGLLIRELGDNTRPTGPVTLGNTSWRSFDVRTDEHALVRTDSGRTVVVIGKAGPTELQALAASLQ